MEAISVIITDAGRAEHINAQQTGTNNFTLTEFAFGTGKNPSSPTQTALQNEFKRLNTMSGQPVDPHTINVTVQDTSNDEYTFSEFGLYTNNGTLYAVYSAPSDIMGKFAASALNMGVNIYLGTLYAATVNFGDLILSNPPAREEVLGVVQLSTQAMAIAGEDDLTAMTPLKTKQAMEAANPLGSTHKLTLVDSVVAAIQMK